MASPTIYDIIGNTLVLHQLAPYLPVPSRLSLAATSRTSREILYNAPQTFRHLDLSFAKSAALDTSPIDSGGNSWRAERMDESLTEDEFYSGPIRGIFNNLSRSHCLFNVQTMILDGLSVPADLIQEIMSDDRFNVRILSVREARHLNARKLMQVLKYAVRPSRPEGTPKLKGLYYFGQMDARSRAIDYEDSAVVDSGVMSADGATIGASWNEKSAHALNAHMSRCDDEWYQRSGKVINNSLKSEWAEVIRACEGIIAFDAVLCRGPRHDEANVSKGVDYSSSDSWLPPSLATVALGPSGCQKCGTFEEGPAFFGVSPSSHLPLLAPPPLHSSRVVDAQRPSLTDGTAYPPLFIRCEDCLRGRWCERCNKSWCSHCYAGQEAGRHPEMGVARDCFGCGRTCQQCKDVYIRTCHKCKSEFCVVDNEGSTQDCCDWCNHSGRRTRELY